MGKKPVQHGIHAIQDLLEIQVGPYEFECHQPVDKLEVRERSRWFRRHEPLPVTAKMLNDQLAGQVPRWKTIETIGKGGFGEISKVMERQTGLMVAIKTQIVRDDREVRQEIKNMKAMAHVRCSIQPFLKTLLTSTSRSLSNTSRVLHVLAQETSTAKS